jgi:hypothetical protein
LALDELKKQLLNEGYFISFDDKLNNIEEGKELVQEGTKYLQNIYNNT